jgi:multidrug efflux system membrane fusion protein
VTRAGARAPARRGAAAAVPGLLPAAALLLAACGQGAPAAGGAPEAIPVAVGVVERRDVPVQIREIGTIEPYATVAVKAQIGGVLEEVHFREGEDVRKGDVLFTLDRRPHEAALEAARAQLARDRVLLENARQDVDRYAGLVDDEFVTREEYDRIRANAAALEAAVRAGEAAVRSAEIQLGYCTIRSPLDGRTGRLMVHEGNLVKANDDVPLVVINQITPVHAAFSVPERRLAEIQVRQAAGPLPARAVVPGGSGPPSEGRLAFLDNKVDAATGTFLMKAAFPNEDRRLWPGQFVNVTLDLDRKPGALLVPTEAVQSGQQGPFVFVVGKDMTVESRPVVIGGTFEQATLVESGVAAGETVVTDGQLRLVPGARVEVKAGVGTAGRGSP